MKPGFCGLDVGTLGVAVVTGYPGAMTITIASIAINITSSYKDGGSILVAIDLSLSLSRHCFMSSTRRPGPLLLVHASFAARW